MSKPSKPKILDVLGQYRSPWRLSDENLKTLHAYCFMILLDADREVKRRKLSHGRDVCLRIVAPE